MTADLVIVADDLTGALDTSAPFAGSKRVAVAVSVDGLAEALAGGADIVAVNTASRALPPNDAATIVSAVARVLAGHTPSYVFKKIDSRLKGNVAAECHALVQGLGRTGLVLAPAVPDQGRITRNGAIEGRGVAAPIALAPAFAASTADICICDAATPADLDEIVASHDWRSHLAVGARGLGQAFARHLRADTTSATFVANGQTLFAFGSRDPITAEQITALRARHPDVTLIEAPAGTVPMTPAALPCVIIATGALDEPGDVVAARFAEGITALVQRLRPANLVMGGGDTALAILNRIGVGLVYPQGEAAPGLPWFTIEPSGAPGIACVVKSGGFGTADVLAELL